MSRAHLPGQGSTCSQRGSTETPSSPDSDTAAFTTRVSLRQAVAGNGCQPFFTDEYTEARAGGDLWPTGTQLGALSPLPRPPDQP